MWQATRGHDLPDISDLPYPIGKVSCTGSLGFRLSNSYGKNLTFGKRSFYRRLLTGRVCLPPGEDNDDKLYNILL